MSRRASHYAELSGRIVSAAKFCEFLDAGGRVLSEACSEGWQDVTADVLHRERLKVRELERIRALLYGDLVQEDDGPRSVMH